MNHHEIIVWFLLHFFPTIKQATLRTWCLLSGRCWCNKQLYRRISRTRFLGALRATRIIELWGSQTFSRGWTKFCWNFQPKICPDFSVWRIICFNWVLQPPTTVLLWEGPMVFREVNIHHHGKIESVSWMMYFFYWRCLGILTRLHLLRRRNKPNLTWAYFSLGKVASSATNLA